MLAFRGLRALRIHLAAIVARGPTVRAVPTVHVRIGRHVRNGPKLVLSVPRQPSVRRLRKVALPPMQRRASAVVSVAAVVAVVVVAAKAAARPKANKRVATLPDSAPAQQARRAAAQPAHSADRD